MSTFAATVVLALWSASTPSEVRDDLDAHPWIPAPTAIAPAETTAGKTAAVGTAKARPQETVAPSNPNPPSGSGVAAGRWQLQLGALQSPEAALSEKRRLEKILGPGTVEILVDGPIHRLRYGDFGSRLEAESARTLLRPRGVEGFPAQHP